MYAAPPPGGTTNRHALLIPPTSGASQSLQTGVLPPSHHNAPVGRAPPVHAPPPLLGTPHPGLNGPPPSAPRGSTPMIYLAQPPLYSHPSTLIPHKPTGTAPLYPPPPTVSQAQPSWAPPVQQQPWAPPTTQQQQWAPPNTQPHSWAPPTTQISWAPPLPSSLPQQSWAPPSTQAQAWATPPIPSTQQSWAPPSSLAFSVPPPGHAPSTAQMYVQGYSHPLVAPPAYPTYPPNPQYVGYSPSLYPPTASPTAVTPTFNVPPPVLPGATRDRSPLRREGERRERSSHREETERSRERERRNGRHSVHSSDEKREGRRKLGDWRDREDRDRTRMKIGKERRESASSSNYIKEGSRPASRRPSDKVGAITSRRLVPYEDDSDTEEVDNRRGRSRDDRDKRDSSRRERSMESPMRAKSSKIKTEPADYAKMTPEQVIESEKKVWIRSAPADLYYTRDENTPGLMRATERSIQLQDKFKSVIIDKSEEARNKHPVEEPPKFRLPSHHSHSHGGEEEECSSSDDDEENPHNHRVESLDWLEFRSKASNRAHPEVWQNMIGELNDGPACRCSKKAKESGIRHGIYVGEKELPDFDMQTNNFTKLHHYRVTISPPTNFLIKHPTIIHHDEHEFIFEGFSMFTVDEIPDLPVCKVVRFNIEYNILYFKEKMPENFTLGELDLFHKYFFHELLELWDWSVDKRYYFMPRFVRDLSENGKEILSMNEVLSYMLNSYIPLTEEIDLVSMTKMTQSDWQRIADKSKGMLVTYPGMKPSTLRVDQLDREQDNEGVLKYPDIVHFGIRPPQLSYAGSQEYQKAWREFVKFRHLLANMAKPTFKDRRELEAKEHALQEMRSNSKLKRDCTAVMSSQGYLKTGLMTDIVQHAMLLPVLINHVRLNNSLDHLEKRINYKFKNRYLLQQAVTHPSYKENFGTNPDHIRNTLSNCGIRQPQYGDKKIHYQNTRKRGINMLINIMSRFGKKIETESKVQHNERLEFLGDAVVEFITSVHLFYMFPDLEEGGLATYRAAIVQNQHLAILAAGLGLERYMLYAHGSDLCHDSELKHAMANCFEALMGAVFLDGGIDVTDRVFSDAMFGSDFDLFDTWVDLPQHPLQTQEPEGDRHWISKFPVLLKLTEFEEMTGIEFTHIRLLSRSFTDRSIGFNNLTLGSNQRMEFLGDTVLQLITSDFLYKHFPDHHEGHLSLLRSSLVNNRTQSVVCDDLGMTRYAMYANPKAEIKVKDKADLLEAFLGALYVDKDLEWCIVFAHVCFFPRLQQFILNQDWNDPKSKLQQCCLTLRTMDGGEPDIPVYKVIECKGPTNTRVYTVAVYFRGERLAKDYGHSIQQAEMNAAKIALEKCSHLFPHLNYQKRIMERSFKEQGVGDLIRNNWYQETLKKRAELGMDIVKKEEPKPVITEDGQCSSEEPATITTVPLESSSESSTILAKSSVTAIDPSVTVDNTPVSNNSDCNSTTARKDNKEAVRKEIQEIEDQLARRKQQKKDGDIEDGECIDSEEDFEKSASGPGEEPALDTSDNNLAKKKEENKKRWGKDKSNPSSAAPLLSLDTTGKIRDRSKNPSGSNRSRSRSAHGKEVGRPYQSSRESSKSSSSRSSFGRESSRPSPRHGRDFSRRGNSGDYRDFGGREGAPYQHYGRTSHYDREDRYTRGAPQGYPPDDRYRPDDYFYAEDKRGGPRPPPLYAEMSSRSDRSSRPPSESGRSPGSGGRHSRSHSESKKGQCPSRPSGSQNNRVLDRPPGPGAISAGAQNETKFGPPSDLEKPRGDRIDGETPQGPSGSDILPPGSLPSPVKSLERRDSSGSGHYRKGFDERQPNY